MIVYKITYRRARLAECKCEQKFILYKLDDFTHTMFNYSSLKIDVGSADHSVIVERFSSICDGTSDNLPSIWCLVIESVRTILLKYLREY